jgi:hypothetical protein
MTTKPPSQKMSGMTFQQQQEQYNQGGSDSSSTLFQHQESMGQIFIKDSPMPRRASVFSAKEDIFRIDKIVCKDNLS